MNRAAECRMAVVSCLFCSLRSASADVLEDRLTTLSIPSRQNTWTRHRPTKKEKADALLIQLRTPGGLVDSHPQHHRKDPCL